MEAKRRMTAWERLSRRIPETWRGFWKRLRGAMRGKPDVKGQLVGANPQEAAERLRAILDASPLPIISIDEYQKVQLWNHAAERVFGWKAEEVLGKPNPVFGKDKQEEARRLTELAAEQGVVREVEVQRYRKDGKLLNIRISVAPVVGRDGRRLGFVAVLADITAQKRAGQEVTDITHLLQSLLDYAPVMVYVRSREGRYLLVNPAWEKTTGLTRLQVVGEEPTPAVLASVASQLHRHDTEVFETGQVINVEEPIDLAGGRRHFQTVRFPLMDATGHVRAVGGISLDVTEKRQALEQLEALNRQLESRVAERTRELEAANRELTEFAYAVSHDLRAPLRSIAGFTQIIQRRYQRELSGEIRHYFENIVTATGRMERLIEDLLRYARLGSQSHTIENVSLAKVIAEACESLSSKLATTGGIIIVQPELPAVRGDATLLSAVFLNLLDNALTYHRPEAPPEVRVTCEERGEQCLVTVADNGIGIPEEHHKKIFRVFQRLHTQEEHPGTGIGLALVERSVRALGGRVWLESRLGEGSRFFLELPRAV